eukprot:scaffold504_cov189-Ochromonas_danica.AAC.3
MVKVILRKLSERKENTPVKELEQNHHENAQRNQPPAKKSTMKKIRGAFRRILGIHKKSKNQEEHYEETELDIPLALPPSNPHLTPPANTSPKQNTRQIAETKSGPNSVQQAIEEEAYEENLQVQSSDLSVRNVIPFDSSAPKQDRGVEEETQTEDKMAAEEKAESKRGLPPKASPARQLVAVDSFNSHSSVESDRSSARSTPRNSATDQQMMASIPPSRVEGDGIGAIYTRSSPSPPLNPNLPSPSVVYYPPQTSMGSTQPSPNMLMQPSQYVPVTSPPVRYSDPRGQFFRHGSSPNMLPTQPRYGDERLNRYYSDPSMYDANQGSLYTYPAMPPAPAPGYYPNPPALGSSLPNQPVPGGPVYFRPSYYASPTRARNTHVVDNELQLALQRSMMDTSMSTEIEMANERALQTALRESMYDALGVTNPANVYPSPREPTYLLSGGRPVHINRPPMPRTNSNQRMVSPPYPANTPPPTQLLSHPNTDLSTGRTDYFPLN